MENRAKKAAELRRREHALFAAAERETAKDEPWSVANARARLTFGSKWQESVARCCWRTSGNGERANTRRNAPAFIGPQRYRRRCPGPRGTERKSRVAAVVAPTGR